MSSIFYNDELIEELLKIAQQKVPNNINQLKNTAFELIKNLKQEASPSKANSNPTFSDLKDMPSFVNWLKTSGATYNNQPIITDGTTFSDRFNSFLVDLRKKSAGNGLYEESIANLIYLLNKSVGTKIDLYEPEEKKQETTPEAPKPAVGPNGEELAKHTQVGVKIGPDGILDPNNQQGTQAQIGAGGGRGVSILDGLIVDMDEMFDAASSINTNTIAKYDPKVSGFLSYQVIAKMRNIKTSFDSLTQKSPSINGVKASPSDEAMALSATLQRSFNSGVNPDNGAHKLPSAYTYEELTKIAISIASMMEQVATFYAAIQRIPSFSSMPEIKKQMEIAENYERNFMSASSQLGALHKSTTTTSIN